MPRLNNRVFISFYNGSFSVWFSSIRAIIHIVGTAVLSRTNVHCVLLASMLNSIFVLLQKLSQHLATVIIRGVFRALWNMMELLVKIHYGFYLHHSFLTGSWIRLWSWYSIFFNQTSDQNLVFLENCNKKGDISYDFTFG